MVKYHTSSYTHDYPFPAVTLAYFLRYPNPYSKHVLSTDVLDRHFDPLTNTLYTTRLHLKRSKIPTPILKLLPASLIGPMSSDGGNNSQSYVLERSLVDMKDGVMVTDSRNLEFTGILTAVERQLYRRPGTNMERWSRLYKPRKDYPIEQLQAYGGVGSAGNDETQTDVNTKIELQSRLGQVRERIQRARASAREASAGASASAGAEDEEADAPKMGFFKAWSTSSIQKSIETFGLRRAERAVPKSQNGMDVVLERLRRGGLVAVLEGMKRDRQLMD